MEMTVTLAPATRAIADALTATPARVGLTARALPPLSLGGGAESDPMARLPLSASALFFKRWLDRIRAEEALVADKRELGAREDGDVILDEEYWKNRKGME